jgi:hypothetical protein
MGGNSQIENRTTAAVDGCGKKLVAIVALRLRFRQEDPLAPNVSMFEMTKLVSGHVKMGAVLFASFLRPESQNPAN